MSASRKKRFLLTRSVIGLVLCTTLAAMVPNSRAAQAASQQAPNEVLLIPEIDLGFRLLYQLKFVEARVQFETWQKSHPQGPLGHASEAASYLFEECYRQGVLTSEFFLDDKRFLGKTPLKPDPELRKKFFAAAKQAQDLAQPRLKSNPNDPKALFAMSLSLGMQADYASLIDKHQLDSLKKIREAETYSKKLLEVAPDAFDAYLGLGTANYIIGSLPGTKKLFLGFAGIHGNKKEGIEQLESAAKHGEYLRPFAKILLALTALREKKPEVARTEFTELVAEFPENPLFASELAKLNVSCCSSCTEITSLQAAVRPDDLSRIGSSALAYPNPSNDSQLPTKCLDWPPRVRPG
jgi:tetratricopeptide (TPR) repeat protein